MKKLLLAASILAPISAHAAGCDSLSTCFSAPLGYSKTLNSNTGGVYISLGSGFSLVNGSLTVTYGNTAGTAAQGNDPRIVGAMQGGNNLSELTSPSSARVALGLGAAAVLGAGPGGVATLDSGGQIPSSMLGNVPSVNVFGRFRISFAPFTLFGQGDWIIQNGNLYYATNTFTTGAAFNVANWTQIPAGSAVTPAALTAALTATPAQNASTLNLGPAAGLSAGVAGGAVTSDTNNQVTPAQLTRIAELLFNRPLTAPEVTSLGTTPIEVFPQLPAGQVYWHIQVSNNLANSSGSNIDCTADGVTTPNPSGGPPPGGSILFPTFLGKTGRGPVMCAATKNNTSIVGTNALPTGAN